MDLYRYASNTDKEECGILIGKKIEEHTFTITNVIHDENPIDQTLFGITRNTNKMYQPINKIVEQSDDNIDFIGDWHSHPNWSCMYSLIDYKSIQIMLKDPDYFFLDEIILIIVKPPNEFAAYLFIRGEQTPITMEISYIECKSS